MSAELEIRTERRRYAPGDTVKGRVRVVKSGRSRSLEVSLDYCESSPDYSAATQTLSAGTVHEGNLEEGESHDFSVELPPDAKPAYSSAHGELWWQVHARSDQRGRDTHVRERIDVR